MRFAAISLLEFQMTDNYRYGEINGSIQPGRPYAGTIIKSRLIMRDETGDPNPYDRWSLDLLLDPPIAQDRGQDVIEIYADNLKIKKQTNGTFDPDTYLHNRVSVVLGDYLEEDTEERYIIEIGLI
jgi:hypothetical protein